jgi:hypothetical protein
VAERLRQPRARQSQQRSQASRRLHVQGPARGRCLRELSRIPRRRDGQVQHRVRSSCPCRSPKGTSARLGAGATPSDSSAACSSTRIEAWTRSRDLNAGVREAGVKAPATFPVACPPGRNQRQEDVLRSTRVRRARHSRSSSTPACRADGFPMYPQKVEHIDEVMYDFPSSPS